MTLDGYKCCKDNKTEWCAMKVKEGTKGGDGTPSFISRKVMLSETEHLGWIMGGNQPWKRGVSEHLGRQNGASP